jgi:predicted Fe-S protein YdhL (DUF1289 family)
LDEISYCAGCGREFWDEKMKCESYNKEQAKQRIKSIGGK